MDVKELIVKEQMDAILQELRELKEMR